jgi:hypothetical protein
MRFDKSIKIFSALFLLVLLSPVFTIETEAVPTGTRRKVRSVIWRSPRNIASRNLYYGEGGKQGMPRGPFTFVKELKSGSRTIFIVKDSARKNWVVKIGDESQPETVATRLLWAAGYFSDVTYYLPKIVVRGVGAYLTSPPDEFVSGDTIFGARFEPEVKEQFVEWSWHDNPFEGTKEFDGLRVMMALMNNWDLKKSNNRIAYDKRSGEMRYIIHDIGACFGKTGGVGERSKNDVDDYVGSKFIDEVKGREVDLELESTPPWILAAYPPYYINRNKMEKVGEEIPREHARWIGRLLSQLSPEQIRDAFRAAHYPERDVERYSRAVRSRIDKLARL